MVSNHLPNSVMSSGKRFCGTTTRDQWHSENPNEVSSMTASQSSRIGGPRFTCRRWVEKDSYAFEWHRKCSRRTSKRPEYGLATRNITIASTRPYIDRAQCMSQLMRCPRWIDLSEIGTARCRRPEIGRAAPASVLRLVYDNRKRQPDFRYIRVKTGSGATSERGPFIPR